MTIFITISRGLIARNILQNKFYDLVKSHFEKVVLITTASDEARFKKEFGASNVEIVPMPVGKESFWDSLVSRMNRHLIFNRSTVGRGLYWYILLPSRAAWILKFLRFTLVRIIFQPLSKISSIRRAIRWFDYKCLQHTEVAQYQDLIRKYHPDIIFATNIIEEAALLKAARREHVTAVAMPKTWDNPSKLYFRARADAIMAWSPFMKEQMVTMQDYRENEVHVFGIPQYDYFLDGARAETRDDFCARVGLDPTKKILCFGSEGKVMTSDADIAEILYDFVSNRALNEDCQLFIRPHFGYKDDEKKFVSFAGRPGVVIDTYNRPSSGFRDAWDYSTEHMNHFLSVIRHADVLVNTGSTLALDAAALGTPTIFIVFDGYEKNSFFISSARWYVCDYLEEFMRYNSSFIADSPESLRESINQLLKNPELLAQNQRKLCGRFCHMLDGNSGERLFQKIYQYATT